MLFLCTQAYLVKGIINITEKSPESSEELLPSILGAEAGGVKH